MAMSTKASKKLFQSTTILSGAFTLLTVVQSANALPTGGNVVGGNANITSSANRVDVNQSTNRSVINWNNFDVGAGEQVNFNQPSSSSVTLNRVVNSNAPSQIYGKLTANGNVVIVNSQGVLFGKGAQVNVGGLVATTADVDNNDFMKGNLNFSKAGNPNAKIQNDGNIKIRNGGLAAFVGPNVVNNGLIEANLGKVQLASGDKFSVDLYGDGLLSLQASKEVNEQLVKNSGQIKANGGKVLLTAAAAESTVNSLINMDGLIEAQGVGRKNGQVVLTGKNVKVSGKIDVSGKTSGGTVLVGGDYQGKGKTPTAQDTYISDTAEILADATENGNGGKVIVWADGTTVFNGRIRARGGKNGGNGGFVETSGKNILTVRGSVDAGADNGANGTWLLDPANIRIATSGGDVLVSTIQNALNAGSNVTVSTGTGGAGAGNITVDNTITKSNGNNATLTLDAFGTITTSNNADIFSTSNKLNVNMTAGGGITLGTNSDIATNGGNATLESGGNIVFANNAKIISSGGNIFLRSTSTNGLINLSNTHSQLNSDKTGSTADGDITLVAKSFSNSSGTDGLVTGGGGRWLIYTEKPANNTLDGLTADFTRYGCSYGGACTLGSGDGLIYSQTIGTLTATPNSITIIYGDVSPSLVNYSYTLSGYNTGDAALDTVTGSLTGSTNYTQGSNIGNYAINYVSGSLSSLLGYSFNYVNNANAIVVNKKTITATLVGTVSKIYDGNNTATLNSGNYSLSGLYGTDAVTISNTSGTYNNKNAGTNKSVSVTGVTLSGAKSGNYQLSSANASGNIGAISKRDLTITANAQNKIYDGNSNATVSFTNNKIAGDSITVNNTSATFNNKNVGTGKTVTVNGISLSGTDSGNYSFSTTATTTANITKRDITVSANASNKVYDGTTTAGVTYSSNKVSGDSVNITATSADFNNKNVGNNKAVSINGISISGTDAGNYNLLNTTAADTANITKRDLTIAATGVDKVYDGTSNATVTLSDNRVSGDNLTTSYGNAFYLLGKDVGTNKTIVVTGLDVSGLDSGNYNLTNFLGAALTSADITKRVLNITAAASNKIYDGNTTASYTLSNNKIVGDSVTVTSTGANFDTKHAGTGKTVTVNGVNVTGGDASNYSFSTVVTTTADITKRDLNIQATGQNKVYDGTTAATVTLTDDRVTGDIFTDSYTAANFSNKSAGDGKIILVEGLSIAGDDASNYNIINEFGSDLTTANISKRDLTVSVTADNKVYDGTRTATVHLTDNRITGDVFTDNYTTARFGNKNAGTGKTVTVNGISISGDDAANYNLVNTTATTLADISKYLLTITATADNKVYDGTRNAVANLSDNRIAGDVFDASYTTARFGGKNVGTGKTVTVNGIDIAGTDARNYTFNTTATTTADVTPKALTISATGVNKVYDGNRSATVTLSDDRIAGDVFDSSYNRASFGGKNVGTGKTVNVFGIDIAGTDARNYTFNTTASTTADITPRTLVVSATGENKIYDGVTNAVVTLGDDRVAGDDLTGSYTSANFADRNAGLGKLITVEGIDFSGRDARNYVFDTTTTTTADITKRDLTVTADSQSKVYGSGDPRLTFSHDELQTGDTDGIFTGALTREAGENVADGPYEISQGTLDAGGNYNINFEGADLTITPYTLIVTADGKTKVYGSADPTLTYTYGNTGGFEKRERFNDLQNGDTADVFTGGLTRDAGEHVANGPYAINQGSLSAGANYNIEYVGAELIVTPASLRVNADNQSVIYGGALPNLTYGVDGLVNGDTNSVFTGGLSTVETNSLPGDYSIDQGSLDAGSDYVITYTPGTMTITSPLSDINTTLLQGLLNPIGGGGGNAGALLSLVLRGNGGGAGGNPLANLETAAGGDGSENPEDLNNLDTAANEEEVVDLMNCSKNAIEDQPCEI